jgi:hypothetical protein
MVKALIDIDEHTNRIINIVKAQHGLRDKSSAIDFIATRYEEEIMEPGLRPEYVEKAERIVRERPVKVGTTEGLRKRIGV